MIIHKKNHIEHSKITIGGKAKSLLELSIHNFNVPEWCVIPERYFKNQIVGNNTKDSFEIKKAIQAMDIETSLIESIKQYLKIKEGDYFSVRSSASDEDGNSVSFAGQYSTFLYVNPNEIATRIKDVCLSAFTDNILAYRLENKLEQNYFLSVIVQKMVASDVSGVAFGANPVTGNRQEKIISSVYGLGEGIVSGELNSDNYTISKGKITEEITIKDRELKFKNNTLEYSTVSKEKREQSTLSKVQINEIEELLNNLKKHFLYPQDIEFAYANEKLFVLQSRPITNLNALPDRSNNYQIWDNSNIIESYPGISSPLTFSFILKVYEAVYVQFCELMGVDKTKIKDNRNTFENMLGSINGKVYYNIINWNKVLSLFPGYSVNKEFMEKMMGVKETITDDVAIKNTDSKFQSKIKLIRSIFKMINEFRILKKERLKFFNYTDKTFRYYSNIEYHKLSSFEIMEHYQVYEKVLLEKWRPPLINDFFAMIFFGVLQKNVEKNMPEHANLANDLLIGSNDIVSIEPLRNVHEILAEIRKDSDTYAFFKTQDSQTIFNEISSINKSIHKKITSYLFKFGDRCIGELKLETKTYATNPTDFIELLKSQLEVVFDVDSLIKKGLEKRAKAEAVVEEAFKGKIIKKILFKYILKKTRDLVSNRENLRFERTKAFGIVRIMFNNIGDLFYAEGVIDNPEDIFFLQQQEIVSFIRGSSVNQNIKALVNLRKKEYELHKQKSTDERFKTYGLTHVGNSFKSEVPVNNNAHFGGIGCSPGIVEKEVKIVKDPRQIKNLEGKIMVCESTDPGWITLFPTCSAIIVERGSLLSHSAIVSREMGIPCIVGVTNLFEKLEDGDIVKMDGTNGTIVIIQKAKVHMSENQ